MNEELLNQLLGAFQDIIESINDVIGNGVNSLHDLNNIVKSLGDGLNVENQLKESDVNSIRDSFNNAVSKIRNAFEIVKRMSGELNNIEPFIGLIDEITELVNNGASLSEVTNRLTSGIQKLSSVSNQVERKVSEVETGIEYGSGSDEGEPPAFGSEINEPNEFPFFDTLIPRDRISTVALPYQDIANSIKLALSRPIDELVNLVRQSGLSFEQITGGLNKRGIQELQLNSLPDTLDKLTLAFDRFANRLYEKSSAIDRAIGFSFAGELIRPKLQELPEDTQLTIKEALGRNQFDELRTGINQFTNTISLIINDLDYMKSVKALQEIPINVGSPEFYKGMFGLPTYEKIPTGQMGIVLSDLRDSVQQALAVFARQLFPEQSFTRESITTLKGFGFSLFTNEAFQNVITGVREYNPELYQKFQPYIENVERIKGIEELNQSLSYLREQLSLFQIADITQLPYEDIVNAFGNINFDVLDRWLSEISRFDELSDDTRQAIGRVRKFINDLGRFLATGEIPEGGLNIEPLIENIKYISDTLEAKVNEYFKTEFPQFTKMLTKDAGKISELPIPKEDVASFVSMVSALNQVTDNIRRLQGNLNVGERLGLWFRDNLERPFTEMVHMNLVNLQWALMLGLSTSIMEVMTRPAYETVYTTVSPIYQSAGNLTGVLPLFNALQSFPHQIEQMTSMLQTSLNSISALLGSRFYAEEAIRAATEISRVQPIQLPEAIEVLTAISTYPSTRPYASNPQFQEQIFNVVQLLSLLAPEQGIQGALFAIREALGGQWRSLQMRFNISPEVIAQYAGIPEDRMRSATGEELIRYLYKGLTSMFGGERVLLQKGAQLDVQINNIIDTLISSLVLPLVSQQNQVIQSLIDRWYDTGIIKTFMPQQYEMIQKLAKDIAEKSGRPQAEIEKQIARETWGTPIGAISGMVAIINNALSDVIGSLNISDVITNLITDFQRKFTERVEAFKSRITGLDYFADDYSEQRKKIAEEFIRGLLGDLRDSIRQVTGMDIGIAQVFMDLVRDAIMGVASQTTGFILKESLLTAINLPGDLMGVGISGIARSLTDAFKGLEELKFDKLRDVFDSLAGFGKGLAGAATWVYVWKLMDAFNMKTGTTDWLQAGRGFGMLMTSMGASHMLGQQDFISRALGTGLFGLSLMINNLNRAFSIGDRFTLSTGWRVAGVSGLAFGTMIADELRRQSQDREAKIGFAGIEGMLAGLTGIMALVSRVNPHVAAATTLISGLGFAGYEWYKTRTFDVSKADELISRFIESKIESIRSTEQATIQQMAVTWSTLGGGKFYDFNQAQLDALSKVIAYTQQTQNIYATSGVELIRDTLLRSGIVSQDRLSEILPDFYNMLARVSGLFTSQVKPLEPGQKVGYGIPDLGEIRKQLETELSKLTGIDLNKLRIEQPEKYDVMKSLIDNLAIGLRTQLESLQITKTGIADVLQQIQPQLAWKQVEDFFYQKPTKIEPIREVSDIQRYVQEVQKALAEMADAFKRLPGELNRLFGSFSKGMVSFGVFSGVSEKFYEMMLNIGKSPEAIKKIGSPVLYPVISQLLSPEALYTNLAGNPRLLSQIIQTFLTPRKEFGGKSLFERATEQYFNNMLEKMKSGMEVVENARKISGLDVRNTLQNIMHKLATETDNAGKRLIQAILRLAANIDNLSRGKGGQTQQYGLDTLTQEARKTIPEVPESIVRKADKIRKEEADSGILGGVFGWISEHISAAWNKVEGAVSRMFGSPEIGGVVAQATGLHKLLTVPDISSKATMITQPQLPQIEQSNITIITNNAQITGTSQVHISQ